MTAPNPLPCPFCGGVKITFTRSWAEVGWWAHCESKRCGAYGPMRVTVGAALTAWNKAPRGKQ